MVTGQQDKKYQLRAVTATMMVHIVTPVHLRSFEFRNVPENIFF